MSANASPFQIVFMNQWHQVAKAVVVEVGEPVSIPPGTIFVKVTANPAYKPSEDKTSGD